ncbi:MAG: hypothetical protein AAF557_07840 [Pseudomonadota bacterium]
MALLDRIRGLLRLFLVRFERQPIRDKAALVAFLRSRSAYVAQTALFGYLKTRMGTQYREIFQDPAFAQPLALAQRQVFLDCLADLTVFAVSLTEGGRLDAMACRTAAAACFTEAANAGLPEEGPEVDEAGSAFDERLLLVNWETAHIGENAFTQSPEGLVQAAPVIEGYKDLDREIVINSIRFRWHDVRRQFRDRADLEALSVALGGCLDRGRSCASKDLI